MKGMMFKYKEIIILLIISVISFAFSENIVKSFFAILFDNYYRTSLICADTSNDCVAVTYETHASLNSEITKYFYVGGGFHIPALNKNYVMFEDGAEICFRRTDVNRYEIFSNMQPRVNNIEEKVKVSSMKMGDSDCIGKTY